MDPQVRFADIPTPPLRRDRRNQKSAEAIRKHVKKLGVNASMINMNRGYPASAPDLGRLQAMMGPHFQGLRMALIKKRSKAIFEWVFDFLGEWVQRTKSLDMKYEKEHVVIEFKTKDDYGWYVYEFSIYVPQTRS